jgi:hypothetical protein
MKLLLLAVLAIFYASTSQALAEAQIEFRCHPLASEKQKVDVDIWVYEDGRRTAHVSVLHPGEGLVQTPYPFWGTQFLHEKYGDFTRDSWGSMRLGHGNMFYLEKESKNSYYLFQGIFRGEFFKVKLNCGKSK